MTPFGALVQQVLEDDADAPQALWPELYGRLRRWLLPWIQKRANHRPLCLDIEDAFQETVARFIRAIKLRQFTYVDEPSTFSWFYVTARNVLSEDDRRTIGTVALDPAHPDLQLIIGPTGADIPLLEELRWLAPEEQTLLKRRVLLGQSLREISQQTGWGLSKCKHISASLLSKLRTVLSEYVPTSAAEATTGETSDGR